MCIAVVRPLAVTAVLVGAALVLTPAIAGGGIAPGTLAVAGTNHPRCGTQTIDLTAPVISSSDVFIKAPVSDI